MFMDINDSSKLAEMVIIQARRDALYGSGHDKVDALRYLRSEIYQAHEKLLSESPPPEVASFHTRLTCAAEDMYSLIKYLRNVLLASGSLGKDVNGKARKPDIIKRINDILARVDGAPL